MPSDENRTLRRGWEMAQFVFRRTGAPVDVLAEVQAYSILTENTLHTRLGNDVMEMRAHIPWWNFPARNALKRAADYLYSQGYEHPARAALAGEEEGK